MKRMVWFLVVVLIMASCADEEAPRPLLDISINSDYSQTGRLTIDVFVSDGYSGELPEILGALVGLVKNPDWEGPQDYHLFSNNKRFITILEPNDKNSFDPNFSGDHLFLEQVEAGHYRGHMEDAFTGFYAWEGEPDCPYADIVVVVDQGGTRSDRLRGREQFPCKNLHANESGGGLSNVTGDVTVEETAPAAEAVPEGSIGNYCGLHKDDREIASGTVQDGFFCTYFSFLYNDGGSLVGRLGYQVVNVKEPFKDLVQGQSVQLVKYCLRFDNLSTGELGRADCSTDYPGIHTGKSIWWQGITLPQSWAGSDIRATWWLFEIMYTEAGSSERAGGVGNAKNVFSSDGRPADECGFIHTGGVPCSFAEGTSAPYQYQLVIKLP